MLTKIQIQETTRNQIATIAVIAIFIGIVFSRALMSIGTITIGVLFFTSSDLKGNFKKYIKNPLFTGWLILFMLYFLSGLYSDNTSDWSRNAIQKLPLFAIPFGLSSLKEIPYKYFRLTILILFSSIFIITVGTFFNFLKDTAQIIENYKYAKVIPPGFGFNHIRYSLLLATSIFLGYYLIVTKKEKLFKLEPYLVVLISFLHFIFIHLFSVRSGLLALYLGVAFSIILYVVQQRKIYIGIIGIFLLITTPFLVYKYVPTITNKINYMYTDISRFMKGESANGYSDGNRLLSMKIGIELGNTSPIIGIGAGDVFDGMKRKYTTEHPDIAPENIIIPHNQFIYTYTAIGILGLMSLLFVTLYPFLRKNNYKKYLWLINSSIIASSFISESTMEIQKGMILWVLFSSWFYFIPLDKGDLKLYQ